VAVDSLRAYVEETLTVEGFPGLSLAVTDRKGLVAAETFGLANIDAGTPMSRKTYFEFGSIGKTFTSVLLLQLRERGELDLDELVTRYLPWFEVRSEHAPITIRHLLTHSGGLMVGADLSSNSRYDVWALRETEVGFPPGSRYLYSNVGYQALGLVVEELAGRRYAEALRTSILEPLGLESTDPEITNEGRHRLAVAYERRYDDRPARRTDPWVPATWLETGTGDGSAAGTTEDLAGFLRALLKRGEGVISPASFELMTTPAIEADDGWWYGLGLELREREGRREIRHGGSMPGFGTTMLGDLDSGLGVAVGVNATDEQDLTEGVAEAILDLYRDAVAPRVRDPLAVEDAADYAGVYVGEAGRLAVSAEGGHLLLDGEPLEPRRSDRFLAARPDLSLYFLRFRREDGRVVEAVHGGDVYRREDSAPASGPAHPPEWNAFPGHYRAYNPWYSNFRIILRQSELMMIFPWGLEFTLVPLPDGSFRVGSEDWWPERLRFDAIVDDAALRANFSGEAYYRVR
jgi:CubicO group peptidase (beta-lactamase class C family)